MLTTNFEMIKDAQKRGYAVPAINTQGGNFDIIRAACYAAEELKSPMILAHYVKTGAYSGNDWFVETAKWLAKKVRVPVSIHLDHGESFEICMEALRLGFTSLMIDGSKMPIEENAYLTQRVIDVAKCFGTPVEAEIGELLRIDEAGEKMKNKNLTKPEEVKRFISLCEPDTLAIGIGNAHGYYKGEPDIKLDILKKSRKFTDIPFVLHGCSGMDNQVIKDAIKLGVSKINFGTHIRYRYVEWVKEAMDKLDHQGHSFLISQYASNKLKDDIKDIILLSGSQGKA